MNAIDYISHAHGNSTTSWVVINARKMYDIKDEGFINIMYYSPPVFLFICALSLVLNIIVIASSSWIKRSFPITLKLNLSLAVAEVYSTLLWMIHLTLFSFLPTIFQTEMAEYRLCIWNATYLLYITSMIVIVNHLLAVVSNIYLKILKPLSNQETRSYHGERLLICVIWCVPHIILPLYHFSFPREDEQEGVCSKHSYFETPQFRLISTTVFVVPVAIIVSMYFHAAAIVSNYQFHLSDDWDVEYDIVKKRTQMEDNAKDMVASFYIFLAYLIAFVFQYVIYCTLCNNCLFYTYGADLYPMLYFNLAISILFVIKTISIPIIYGVYIKEIKEGLAGMRDSLCHRLKP